MTSRPRPAIPQLGPQSGQEALGYLIVQGILYRERRYRYAGYVGGD